MNYIQTLLARAAEIRAGLTREEALAGIAEVTGCVMPVDVETPNQGDTMPRDPEDEVEPEDSFSDVDADAAADQEEQDDGEDCETCGGCGWLDDPSDGGTMNCDDCDGTGKQ